MKHALSFAIFLLLQLSVFGQSEDCDKLRIAGLYDIPSGPDLDKVILLLTVEEEAPWLFGGYTDLFFINARGDAVTLPSGPHHVLPTSPADTFPYVLPLNEDMFEFPDPFEGTLITRAPDCVLVYTRHQATTDNQPVQDRSVDIYPNPVRNRLTVAGDGIDWLVLYDRNGRFVSEHSYNQTGGGLEMSHLHSGVYILQIKFEQGWSVFRKIVKQ